MDTWKDIAMDGNNPEGTTAQNRSEKAENGLARKLGLFPVTNIVIANMIGAGIFTTSGLLMRDLRNPWLMIALWVVGGLIALCGALSYGELGAAIPRAGGVTAASRSAPWITCWKTPSPRAC